MKKTYLYFEIICFTMQKNYNLLITEILSLIASKYMLILYTNPYMWLLHLAVPDPGYSRNKKLLVDLIPFS